MHQLAGVFLKMNALDPNGVRAAVITSDCQVSVFTKGTLVLGYLVSFGQIRIEIVFAGEAGLPADSAIQRESGLNTIFHGFLVQYREGPGLSGTDGTNMCIGRCIRIGGTVAE